MGFDDSADVEDVGFLVSELEDPTGGSEASGSSTSVWLEGSDASDASVLLPCAVSAGTVSDEPLLDGEDETAASGSFPDWQPVKATSRAKGKTNNSLRIENSLPCVDFRLCLYNTTRRRHFSTIRDFAG